MDSPVDSGEYGDSPKRQWIPNPNGLPEIYSNYIHANWSLFDTRILFGRLKPRLGDSGDFIVEEQGAVFLSWAQTKNLATMLENLVKAYESVNGELGNLKIAPNLEEMKNESE